MRIRLARAAVVLSLLGMGTSCKFANSSTVSRLDCTALASNLALTLPDSTTSPRVIGACSYAVSDQGALLLLSSVNGNTWMYTRGRTPLANYTFSNSLIANAFDASRVTPVDVLAWLDTQAVSDGAIMMSVFNTNSAGVADWYESAGGGTATLTFETANGIWPRNAGEQTALTTTLADVLLRPRTTLAGFARANGSVQTRLEVMSSGSGVGDGGAADSRVDDGSIGDASAFNQGDQ